MATKEELAASLEGFCESCNSNEQLKAMTLDWDRRIGVKANDIDAGFTITYQDGVATVQDGFSEDADLKAESDCETLVSVFYGEVTPAQPYADGTLRILGSEDDILRLDFVSLLIWGE